MASYALLSCSTFLLAFFQEYAAEKTMESLHSLSSPTGIVSRSGQTVSVPSAEIVPGDMVELKTGVLSLQT